MTTTKSKEMKSSESETNYRNIIESQLDAANALLANAGVLTSISTIVYGSAMYGHLYSDERYSQGNTKTEFRTVLAAVLFAESERIGQSIKDRFLPDIFKACDLIERAMNEAIEIFGSWKFSDAHTSRPTVTIENDSGDEKIEEYADTSLEEELLSTGTELITNKLDKTRYPLIIDDEGKHWRPMSSGWYQIDGDGFYGMYTHQGQRLASIARSELSANSFRLIGVIQKHFTLWTPEDYELLYEDGLLERPESDATDRITQEKTTDTREEELLVALRNLVVEIYRYQLLCD